MARSGTGYFDQKGAFFKTPRDATLSDLAGLLGQIGEGDSLATGIAQKLFERRADITALFAEHDAMVAELNNSTAISDNGLKMMGAEANSKIAKLPTR